MKTSLRALAIPALCASLLCACALTSKSEPLTPRYYSPEYVSAPPRTVLPASTARPGAGQALRLGEVRGGSHLRERILYRDQSDALGYYEERRWTERPEDYLRRALARALFEERGLSRIVAGAAPTLEVELIGFEEIRAPARRVRVQALVLLHDERLVWLQETVTIERPVRSGRLDDAGPVVASMSEALREAVRYIADRVTVTMAALAPEGAQPAAAPRIEANALER